MTFKGFSCKEGDGAMVIWLIMGEMEGPPSEPPSLELQIGSHVLSQGTG